MEQDNELKNTPRNEKVAQHEQHPETVEPSYEDLNNAYKKVQQAMYADEAEKKKALKEFLNIKDNLLQNAEEHIKNLKTSSSYVERMVEEGHPYEWGTTKRNALLSEKQHIADAESLRSMINKTNQAHAHLMGAYNTFLLRGESDNTERTEHFSKAYSSLRRNIDAEYEKVENLPILKNEKEEILKEIEKNADETEKFYKKTIQNAKEHVEEMSTQEQQETQQESKAVSEENIQETPLTSEEKGEQVMKKLQEAEKALRKINILGDTEKLKNIVDEQVRQRVPASGTEIPVEDVSEIVKQVDDEVHKNNALKRWYKQKAKGYSRTKNAKDGIKQYIRASVELQIHLRSLKSSERENGSMSQEEIPMFKTDHQQETAPDTGAKRVQIKTESQEVATEKRGEMSKVVNPDKETPAIKKQETPQELETASEGNKQETQQESKAVSEENIQETPLTSEEKGEQVMKKLQEAEKALRKINILGDTEKLKNIVDEQVRQRVPASGTEIPVEDVSEIVKQVDDEIHKHHAFKRWYNRQPRTYSEGIKINQSIRQYITAFAELQIHLGSLKSSDRRNNNVSRDEVAISRTTGLDKGEIHILESDEQETESQENDNESVHVVQENEYDLYSILENHGMTDAEIIKLMEILNGDSETIHDIGITSGNLDDIQPGDRVNLEKINEIVHAEDATNTFAEAA